MKMNMNMIMIMRSKNNDYDYDYDDGNNDDKEDCRGSKTDFSLPRRRRPSALNLRFPPVTISALGIMIRMMKTTMMTMMTMMTMVTMTIAVRKTNGGGVG